MSLGYGCGVELQQDLWRAAYWLEEHGKDRVQDASALLKEALDLLRQYKAAPALQAEVQAAHEVTCTWPTTCIIHASVLAEMQSHVGSQPCRASIFCRRMKIASSPICSHAGAAGSGCAAAGGTATA